MTEAAEPSLIYPLRSQLWGRWVGCCFHFAIKKLTFIGYNNFSDSTDIGERIATIAIWVSGSETGYEHLFW